MMARPLLVTLGLCCVLEATLANTCSMSGCPSGECTNPPLSCQACGYRRVLSSSGLSCLDCAANCVDCKADSNAQTTTCVTCVQGYRVKSDGTCEACASNCLKCDTSGAGKCDVDMCEARFTYVTADSSCKACAAACIKCNTNGPGKCDDGECTSRFVFNANTMMCEGCASNCKSCNGTGAGKCDTNMCDDRYVRTESQTCSACGSYCNQCTLANKCDSGQCYLYYGLNSNNDQNICARCDTNCDGNCNNAGAGNCDSGHCNQGYRHEPTTNRCQACSVNCLTCDTAGEGKCDSTGCRVGYGYRSTDESCVGCGNNCDECTVTDAAIVCTKCSEGYQAKDGTACDYCPANCRVCTLTNGRATCTSSGCEPGYAQENGQCYACPSNCAACTSSNGGTTSCTNCNPRYTERRVDSNNICVECPEGCSQCTDTAGTVKCDFGYCDSSRTYNAIEGTCPACPTNCDSCYVNSDGQVICTQCASGNTVSANQQGCEQCPSNCVQCEIVDGSVKCLDQQCRTGYVLTPSFNCVPCSDSECERCLYSSTGTHACLEGSCISGAVQDTTDVKGCHTCSYCASGSCSYDSTTSQATCSGCIDNYIVNNNGYCDGCATGCKTCTGTAVAQCSACKDTYVQIPSDACVKCPMGCSACSESGNQITCSGCQDSYQLSNGNCYPCPENCGRCTFSLSSAKALCTNCNLGYTVNSNTNLCEACAGNCFGCDVRGAGKCDDNSCNSGFTLNTNTHLCEACGTQCSSCDTNGATYCDTNRCNTGYILGNDNRCKACASPAQCLSCSSESICSQCILGYTVGENSASCQPCPSNCDWCTFSSGQTKCNWGGCKYGHVMKLDRTCLACPTGCAVCKLDVPANPNQAICIDQRCNVGYTVNDQGVCNACPAGCQTCSYDGVTLKCNHDGCKVGYRQDGVNCLKCADNCLQCDTAGSLKCDVGKCEPAYGLKTDETCGPCSDGNCGACTTQGYLKCDSGSACNVGFGLDSNDACLVCGSNCKTCNTAGAGSCDQCENTFFLASDSTCTSCGTGCNTCNSDTDCTACAATGYTLVTGTCNECAANCDKCDTAGANMCDVTDSDMTVNGCSANYLYNPDGTVGNDDYCFQDCATDCAAGKCSLAKRCDSFDCEGKFSWSEVDSSSAALTPAGSYICLGCTSNCDGCKYAGSDKCDPVSCTSGNSRNPADQQCHADCDTAGQPTLAQCTHCYTSTTACETAAYCATGTRFSTAGLCEACGSDCANCDADSTLAMCGICDASFYLKNDDTCGAFTGVASCAILDPASEVEVDYQCLLCDVAFYENAGCQGCVTGCDWCMDGTTCDQCGSGYYKDSNGACTELPTSAARVTSSGTTTSCGVSQLLDGSGVCTTACTGDCAICVLAADSSQVCRKCSDGHFMQADGSCTASICSEDCAECDNWYSCKTCNSGYYRIADTSSSITRGYCLPLKKNCKSGTTSCTECQDGFYKDTNNADIPCLPCLPNCKTCTSGGCSECMAGFYSTSSTDKSLTCTPCGTACETCNGATCESCKAGFYLANGYSSGDVLACRSCGAYCTSCNTAGACTACQEGFKLESAICEPCAAYCTSCLTEGSTMCDADQCWSGFVYDSTSKTCDGVCMADCASCQTTDFCDQCATGKVPEKDSQGRTTACQDRGCADNCAECDEYMKCNIDKCNSNYGYADSTRTCQACSEGCNSCNTGADFGAGMCDADACIDGYAYDSTDRACHRIFCSQSPNLLQNVGANTCGACTDTGCQHCYKDINSVEHCTPLGCKTGYMYDSGACRDCPSNCDSCYYDGSTTLCIESGCERGYARDAAGNCAACPTNCDECILDSGTSTIVCKPNECSSYALALTASTCIRCPHGCGSCSFQSSDNSLPCSSGQCLMSYTQLPALACYPCPSNCEQCAYSTPAAAAICTTGRCAATFVQQSGTFTCIACPANCLVCSLDSSGNSVCDSGKCNVRFAQDPQTMECHACPTGCGACAYDSTSQGNTKCLPGSCENYFVQKTDGSYDCVQCADANCKLCTLSSNGQTGDLCLDDRCETGYGINPSDLSCVSCGDGCTDCVVPTSGTVTDSCTVCASAYVLQAGTCHACPDNCVECTYDTINTRTMCVSNRCLPAFAQNTDDTQLACLPCPQNCNNCAYVSGETQCTDGSCAGGYAKNPTSGSCEACPSHCNACTYGDSGTLCSTNGCSTGYTVNTNNGQCEACDANCNACNDVSPGECNSNACNVGYMRASDKTCHKCADNCYSCSVAGECTVCIATYEKNGANTCTGCPSNCGTGSSDCTWDSTNSRTKCTNCQSGYGVVQADFSCKACPTECAACTDDGTGTMVCSTCNNAFILNAEGCGGCPLDCKACTIISGLSQCTLCEDGFALKDGTCTECPADCTVCEFSGETLVCSACTSGAFALDQTKLCKSCSSLAFAQCVMCTDWAAADQPNECTYCSSGYTLKEDASECLSCTAGLSNCATSCVDNLQICSGCDSDHTAIQNGVYCGLTCHQCDGPNCGMNLGDDGSQECWSETGDSGCWMYRQVTGTGPTQVIVHKRGCAVNQTSCTSEYRSEKCQHVGSGDSYNQECVKCCTKNNCNNALLTGEGPPTAAVPGTMTLLLVAMAAALVTENFSGAHTS